MEAVLIQIQPLDPATNTRVTIFVADAPGPEWYGLGGVQWEPALIERPSLAFNGLVDTAMSGKVATGTAAFSLGLAEIEQVANPDALNWQSAPVLIYTATDLNYPNRKVEFSGFVSSQTPDLDRRTVALQCSVSTALMDKPLLTASFDGSAGLGGDAGKRGTLLPSGFGVVKNIQPIWFDQVRNIGMIDGYGNTLSIDWLGEGLSSFGPPVANYATYTALAAAIDAKQVPPGRWATCVAQGLVGLGAPQVGIITVHATFGGNRLGTVMYAILKNRAGISADLLDQPSFVALDTAVPYGIHYWTADQRSCLDLVEAMAQSCNATPLVTFQGKVSITRAVIGAPSGTLDRSGSIEPRVLNWASAQSSPPFSVVTGRAARPASVLTYDQVNYDDTLVDRGLYDPTVTYRAGNVVWLRNKSEWLYINALPTAGNPPPDPSPGDQYWQNLAPAPDADDLLYLDGTPIQQLQPSEPGSDVTANNVSADTSNVSGVPSSQVVQQLGAAIYNISDLYSASTITNQTVQSISDELSSTQSDLDAVQLDLQNAETAISGFETRVGNRPNIVPGGSGERGIDGWEAVGCTLVAQGDSSFGPHISLVPNQGATRIVARTPKFQVFPGLTYTVTCDSQVLLNSGGASSYIAFHWLDASGQNIGTSTGFPVRSGQHPFDTTSAGRNAHQHQANAPMNAVSAQAKFIVESFTAGAIADCRVRQVKAELGFLPWTSYTEEAALYSTNASIKQVDTVRASDQAANASRFVSIESRVTGTEGVANSAAANYTTLANTVATANAAQGTVNSILTARLRQGSPNLLPGGDFSDGLNNWATSGSGWIVIFDSDRGPFLQNGGGSAGAEAWRDVPVTPGNTYSLSAEQDPDTPGQGHIYVAWLNSNGNSVGFGSSDLYGDNWTRMSTPEMLAPSGAATARIICRRDAAGGNLRFTRIQFQLGPTTDYHADATLRYSFARITDVQNVLVNADAVLAQRTSTVEAQLRGDQDSGLSARVEQNRVAAVDQTRAVAQDVSTLSANYGSLSASVSQNAGAIVNLQDKYQAAHLTQTASVPGATAAVIIEAENQNGDATSDVALLARKLMFLLQNSNDPSQAILGMEFVLVNGVPTLQLHGNLVTDGSVGTNNLTYGTTGNVSKYYFQTPNDNSQTDWSAGPMGVGLVSQQGAPIEGRAVMTATNLGTPGAVTYIKVIRVSDGTAVWGGSDGVPFKFPSDGTYMSVPIEFMDSVPAGTYAQYDVRVRQTGGGNTRTVDRIMTIREMVRDKFDQIWIVAPAGEGPGAGSGGGGQINGDTTGGGGTGGTPTYTGGQSGLGRKQQIP